MFLSTLSAPPGSQMRDAQVQQQSIWPAETKGLVYKCVQGLKCQALIA